MEKLEKYGDFWETGQDLGRIEIKERKKVIGTLGKGQKGLECYLDQNYQKTREIKKFWLKKCRKFSAINSIQGKVGGGDIKYWKCDFGNDL